MAGFTTLRTIFIVISFLLVFTKQATQVAAARQLVANAKGPLADRKQPEFFFDHTGGSSGVFIPGLGRVGGGGTNPRYIPGLDDTFVPNPGYEIPNPFRGGGIRPNKKAAAAAP
ncbi:hypothetical protein ACLOJK_015295 [Asimina triloba]